MLGYASHVTKYYVAQEGHCSSYQRTYAVAFVSCSVRLLETMSMSDKSIVRAFLSCMGRGFTASRQQRPRVVTRRAISAPACLMDTHMQMDVNNDGMVGWEELSSSMISMGMDGWAGRGIGMPVYAYAGQLEAARPAVAADEVQHTTRAPVR